MHSQKNQIHFTIFVFWPGDLMSVSVSFDGNYKHTCIHGYVLNSPKETMYINLNPIIIKLLKYTIKWDSIRLTHSFFNFAIFLVFDFNFTFRVWFT